MAETWHAKLSKRLTAALYEEYAHCFALLLTFWKIFPNIQLERSSIDLKAKKVNIIILPHKDHFPQPLLQLHRRLIQQRGEEEVYSYVKSFQNTS